MLREESLQVLPLAERLFPEQLWHRNFCDRTEGHRRWSASNVLPRWLFAKEWRWLSCRATKVKDVPRRDWSCLFSARISFFNSKSRFSARSLTTASSPQAAGIVGLYAASKSLGRASWASRLPSETPWPRRTPHFLSRKDFNLPCRAIFSVPQHVGKIIPVLEKPNRLWARLRMFVFDMFQQVSLVQNNTRTQLIAIGVTFRVKNALVLMYGELLLLPT